MTVEGHSPVSTFNADASPVLFSKGEYHPSAMSSIDSKTVGAAESVLDLA